MFQAVRPRRRSSFPARKSWKKACSMHVSEFSFDWQVFVTMTKFMFQAVQSILREEDRRCDGNLQCKLRAIMQCSVKTPVSGEYSGLSGSRWTSRELAAGQAGPQRSLCLCLSGLGSTLLRAEERRSALKRKVDRLRSERLLKRAGCM